MKKIILTIMATTAITTGAISCINTQNPLLEEWNTPHQTPPFESIRVEHIMPAVEVQMAEARAAIDAIAQNPEPATFKNTIEALERTGEGLGRTLGVVYNLNSANTSDQLQEVMMTLAPMLNEYNNDRSLNPVLFARVKAVWEGREGLSLSTEEAKLLENTYLGFTRSGANLSDQDKATYRKISKELSVLGVQFDKNELAAINQYTLHITSNKDLVGLPEYVIEAAKLEAENRQKEGCIFTLQAPSYLPFMKYSENRNLRQEIFTARGRLCAQGDQNDNTELIKRTAELRLQRAKLLGYPTYAHYALEQRMAKDPETVGKFLGQLLDKTINHAKNDLQKITKYAHQNGHKGELMPWDFSYWNEKYITEKLQVNEQMTKPYFKLEDAEKAMFMLAEKLWGLTFVRNDQIPVYHPEVLPYEVMDRDGSMLGVLYCDYFPRESKNSGAWMNSFRDAEILANGTVVKPIVVLVNNFTKPTATTPSLLTFNEFETMLHEFGHGLHGLLGVGKYSSLTGTAVYRDFVELPSQLLENWAYEKEYLNLFAKHYQTGEPMPAELIEKLIAAKNHLAAYQNVTQVRYGMLDMAWHSITEPVAASAEKFERTATVATQIMPTVEGVYMSPSFGHIFAGGYAAGYYSYKWAEVLDADAFSKFKKAGIFDTKTAESLRKNILEPGGTEHPMELYVRFAGAEPSIDPLIDRMGLFVNEQ